MQIHVFDSTGLQCTHSVKVDKLQDCRFINVYLNDKCMYAGKRENVLLIFYRRVCIPLFYSLLLRLGGYILLLLSVCRSAG